MSEKTRLEYNKLQLLIIRRAMKKAGVVQADIGELLGINQSNVNRLLTGKRPAKVEEIMKISKFLNLDVAHVLASGEYDHIDAMQDYSEVDWDNLSPEQEASLAAEIEDNHNIVTARREREAKLRREQGAHRRAISTENHTWSEGGAIPEVDVAAGAGEGFVGEVVTLELDGEAYSGHPVIAEWKLPETYMAHELHINPGRTLVMRVVGDSMYPTYNPGDRVLIDMRQTQIVNDGIYVISDGDSPPQIKRVERVYFSSPPEVLIISDNPSHTKQRVPMQMLKVFGRVAGRVSAS